VAAHADRHDRALPRAFRREREGRLGSGYTATDGVVLRTTDKGKTWQSVGPPNATGLQFRDIEAFDKDHAVIMSIGNNPTDFRMYVTSDGGAHWTQTFTNSQPTAFYDCMTFFDKKRGLAVSDPVNGKFQIISTDDGGMSWQLVSQRGCRPRSRVRRLLRRAASAS
jgi:photosystem II stability/assembly factor-like uncharacterized protein